MKTVIQFPTEAWAVTVVAPEAELRVAVNSVTAAVQAAGDREKRFFEEWGRWSAFYHIPYSPSAPRNRAIVRRVIAEHGLDKALGWISIWWKANAREQGVFDGKEADAFVLFAFTVRQLST